MGYIKDTPRTGSNRVLLPSETSGKTIVGLPSSSRGTHLPETFKIRDHELCINISDDTGSV